MSEGTRNDIAGGEERVGGEGRYGRVYVPAEIQRAIRRKVEESMDAFAVSGLVVEGTLGQVGEGGRYPYIYGVQLLDPVEGTRVELAIPRRLAERARMLQRSSVRVRGDLEPNLYQGKLTFRLSVREVYPAEPETAAEDAGPRDKRLAEILKGYRRGEPRFPLPANGRGPVTLDVIHPSAGVVLDDFLGQLRDADQLLRVRSYPVSTGSSDELLRAVYASRGDVVVIIRGGGSPEDFEPLNEARLAEAWMEKDAFTVCAVGHATDGTVLDPLSDLSCPTPTAAGAAIRERLKGRTAAPLGPGFGDAARAERPKLALVALAALSVVLLALLAWVTLGG